MTLPAQDKKQQNTEYTFHKNNVLKVSNAAKILGISPSSLRRFEEEGRMSSFRDPGNGYRYYRLDLIKELKKELEESKNNLNKKNKVETYSKYYSQKSDEHINTTSPGKIERQINKSSLKLKSEVKSTKRDEKLVEKVKKNQEKHLTKRKIQVLKIGK